MIDEIIMAVLVLWFGYMCYRVGVDDTCAKYEGKEVPNLQEEK